MGQKVNPIGLRLGINRTWDSRWYANDENYAGLLHEDIKLREFLFDRLSQAGISRVVIERPAKKARVTIHSARPGVVIGKKGADIEKLRQAARRGGNRADRVVPRRPGAASHPARRRRLRYGDRPDNLRRLRRQGLDLQGRNPRARPDGAGQASPGTASQPVRTGKQEQ